LIAFSLMPTRLVSFACVFLSICVVSCGGPAATPKASPFTTGVQHASLTVNGLKRTYRLYVPPSLDPSQPAPLVLVLNGCPGTGDEMASLTGFDDLATTGRFVAVYPDPTPDSSADPSNLLEGCWNAGTCCGDASTNGVDDVTFISRLLDRLTADSRIDKTRVFAAGLSSGAMMAYRLACQLSDRIVAAASVAGALVINDCRPARPVSILEMHGTDDFSVPYEGGFGAASHEFPSVASVIQRWVMLDGCTGLPTQTAKGITKTSVWIHCRAGAVVRLDTVTGGNHTWFGTDLNPTPGEPVSTTTVWDFFKNLAPKAAS
jgi:polyhydroxybutyrate depolymerase